MTAPQPPTAIRCIRVLGGKTLIDHLGLEDLLETDRVRPDAPQARAQRLLRGAPRSRQLVDVHHDVAVKSHTSPPPVILSLSADSVPPAISHRHVRPTSPCLAHVDERLAHPRFVAGGGLQVDILVQIEQLLLGIISPLSASSVTVD